jgi:hypothetical protein
MERQPGKMTPGQMVDSQILDDQGIRADLVEGGQGLDKLPALPLFDQGVEGDIEFPAALAADLNQRGDLCQAEVSGIGPGTKSPETDIDRIGPIVQGGKKGFDTARRGQEFEFRVPSFEFRV